MRLLVAVSLLMVSGSAGAEGVLVTTSPARVGLGRTRMVTLTVQGLPGRGPVLADVNVGRLERCAETPTGAVLSYVPPRQRFPQWLYIVLFRDGKTAAGRVALEGHTYVPVKTRARSRVRLKLGDQTVGPFVTKQTGRIRVPLLVPPDVDFAMVEVTDRHGMSIEKRVEIKQYPYRRLALLAVKQGSGKKPAFLVGLTGPAEGQIKLQVNGEDIPLNAVDEGHWAATFTPAPKTTTIRLRASRAGDRFSTVEKTIELPSTEPPPPPPRVVQQRVTIRKQVPPPPPPRRRRRIHVTAAVLAGMQHNFGEFIGPRFAGELGADYELPIGRLGLRVAVGYSWAGQTVRGMTGLDPAESSLSLLPVHIGLSYELDLARLRPGSWVRRLSPYLAAGYLLQVLRTANISAQLGEVRRTDLESGAFGAAGMELVLGPGGLALELGYEWSHAENEDLRFTGSGLLIELGYRLRL